MKKLIIPLLLLLTAFRAFSDDSFVDTLGQLTKMAEAKQWDNVESFVVNSTYFPDDPLFAKLIAEVDQTPEVFTALAKQGNASPTRMEIAPLIIAAWHLSDEKYFRFVQDALPFAEQKKMSTENLGCIIWPYLNMPAHCVMARHQKELFVKELIRRVKPFFRGDLKRLKDVDDLLAGKAKVMPAMEDLEEYGGPSLKLDHKEKASDMTAPNQATQNLPLTNQPSAGLKHPESPSWLIWLLLAIAATVGAMWVFLRKSK